jgi:hypothetical protein
LRSGGATRSRNPQDSLKVEERMWIRRSRGKIDGRTVEDENKGMTG